MRVMVIIQSTPESETGAMPSERLLKEMADYNDELVKAGIMLAGEGLHASAKGKRLVWKKGETKPSKVIDGPFTESKELVAGFWIWQVKSMEEAVLWAQRIPNSDGQAGVVELRPVHELDDFGDAMTPELREQEDRQRAEIARLQRTQ